MPLSPDESTPHLATTLLIRAVELPGLYDALLVDAHANVFGEFRDITSYQVNSIATKHNARIQVTPDD